MNNINKLDGFRDVIKHIKSVYDVVISGEIPVIEDDKHQAINKKWYDFLDGRIELRYFGGDEQSEYEDRFDEIQDETLRACYMLQIAHSDDFEKEYRKYLYDIFNDYIEISALLYKNRVQIENDLDFYDDPKFDVARKYIPKKLLQYKFSQ